MLSTTEIQILLIEDDALQRKSLFDMLTGWKHQVQACDSISDARKFLAKAEYDLILSDMKLADGNSLDFIREQKEKGLQTNFVIMTAFADVTTAVQALKLGAYDYLPKPFEAEQLEKIVRNVAATVNLTRRVSSLSRLTIGDNDGVWQFDNMIGTDEALRPIFETAQRVAGFSGTTVLILGESGTGKGMLAKAIHRFSSRADKPFVDINCSAIPAQLMESEIFGYEKGAFTDAKVSKPGLLEIAEGGTVFLDEIGDMELNLQSKLLKIIEEKEFRRLGSGKTISVDVRIIAATSRNLDEMVKQKKFREDLFYRLSVVPITLPPLRDQKSCILPLAHFFLRTLSKSMGRKFAGFTGEAIQAMTEYSWFGNVRELRNAIERGVILATGEEVPVEALGLKSTAGSGNVSSAQHHESVPFEVTPMSLAECEKKLIESVLKSVDGNKNKAAEALKIHRTTLYKKIEEYGIV